MSCTTVTLLKIMLKITCGVSQGSVLGPIPFFNICKDLSNVSNLLHFIIFADGRNAVMINKAIDPFVNSINMELNVVGEWFKAGLLKLS